MPSPIIHKRSAPAPKQAKFPARRHNTRASSSSSRSAPRKLVKRQSTLTQLDFVSSTPYSTRDVISNTSEEDEEYFEPRPKRRKKQSTLTQKWGGQEEHWEEDDDDDSILVEEDQDEGEDETSPKKAAQDTQFAGTYLYGRMKDVSSELQSPSMVPSSSDAGDLSTRPTTADSKANPKTPRKQLRTEVPSSQTPSSALLSGRRTEVSPLKGRSCTPIPMKMLRSASPSKSILKHMDSDILKLGNRDINTVPWRADIVSSPRRKEAEETPKRKLVRATTIQDSQDVDEWPVTVDITDAQKGTPHPRSSLKRTATVLDSQSESDLDDHTGDADDDKDITVIHISQKPRKPAQKSQVRFSEHCQTVPDYHEEMSIHDEEADDDEEEEEEEVEYNYTQSESLQQQTFDPVSAALDRDAARFGRETQSQFPLPQDAESDYDTAEEGHEEMVEFVAESPVPDPETQFVADSPVRHTVPTIGDQDVMQSLPPIIPDLSMPQSVAEESLPLPRPSQVSTVVSTQQTTSRPNSADGGKDKGGWENSSPIPLPPESWRTEQGRRRWETQSSDVYDFSLPMPPPLPSSSVRGGG